MRLLLDTAMVDTPDRTYSNAFVELTSDDDLTLTATVNNRQGTTLAVFTGPFVPDEGRSWAIATTSGEVVVTKQSGCGCGGTSVEPKPPEG